MPRIRSGVHPRGGHAGPVRCRGRHRHGAVEDDDESVDEETSGHERDPGDSPVAPAEAEDGQDRHERSGSSEAVGGGEALQCTREKLGSDRDDKEPQGRQIERHQPAPRAAANSGEHGGADRSDNGELHPASVPPWSARPRLRTARSGGDASMGWGRQEAGVAEVKAEMVANVWKVVAQAGEPVEVGDTLVILESMKMEIPVVAETAGTLAELQVEEGQVVQEGDVIAVIR